MQLLLRTTLDLHASRVQVLTSFLTGADRAAAPNLCGPYTLTDRRSTIRSSQSCDGASDHLSQFAVDLQSACTWLKFRRLTLPVPRPEQWFDRHRLLDMRSFSRELGDSMDIYGIGCVAPRAAGEYTCIDCYGVVKIEPHLIQTVITLASARRHIIPSRMLSATVPCPMEKSCVSRSVLPGTPSIRFSPTAACRRSFCQRDATRPTPLLLVPFDQPRPAQSLQQQLLACTMPHTVPHPERLGHPFALWNRHSSSSWHRRPMIAARLNAENPGVAGHLIYLAR